MSGRALSFGVVFFRNQHRDAYVLPDEEALTVNLDGDEMPANLRTALVPAGAAVVTALAVLGTATPAFAKSDTQLSGPRVAHARHAFGLTASVGDDAGVRPAKVRLQVRGAHGRYQWFGTWHRLHRTDRYDESYTFRVTENHPATATFRVVVSSGYAITNPVTVVVRWASVSEAFSAPEPEAPAATCPGADPRLPAEPERMCRSSRMA